MEVKDMTKDDKSLLLYLETCAVDKEGKVDSRKMNEIDHGIAKCWDEAGFIVYRRMPAKTFMNERAGIEAHYLTYYVMLAAEARKLAHTLREVKEARGVERLACQLEDHGILMQIEGPDGFAWESLSEEGG